MNQKENVTDLKEVVKKTCSKSCSSKSTSSAASRKSGTHSGIRFNFNLKKQVTQPFKLGPHKNEKGTAIDSSGKSVENQANTIEKDSTANRARSSSSNKMPESPRSNSPIEKSCGRYSRATRSEIHPEKDAKLDVQPLKALNQLRPLKMEKHTKEEFSKTVKSQTQSSTLTKHYITTTVSSQLKFKSEKSPLIVRKSGKQEKAGISNTEKPKFVRSDAENRESTLTKHYVKTTLSSQLKCKAEKSPITTVKVVNQEEKSISVTEKPKISPTTVNRASSPKKHHYAMPTVSAQLKTKAEKSPGNSRKVEEEGGVGVSLKSELASSDAENLRFCTTEAKKSGSCSINSRKLECGDSSLKAFESGAEKHEVDGEKPGSELVNGEPECKLMNGGNAEEDPNNSESEFSNEGRNDSGSLKSSSKIPRKTNAAHSGLKFHSNLKKETVPQSFSFENRCPNIKEQATNNDANNIMVN